MKHMNRVVRSLVASIGLVALAACAQPAMDNGITEISIERDCFGCTTGSVLVLRRDGTATLTVTGKSRHGTQGSSASGSVSRAEFDALARLVTAKGFFQMQDSYEDLGVQDGAWVTTRVLRGSAGDKQVVHRDSTGPEGLKQMEAAIAALQARIQFVPDRR